MDLRSALSGVRLHASLLPPGAELDLDDLSKAEVVMMATFASADRRRAFALGRKTMRRVLARWLDTPPREIDIVVADDGALDVPGTGMHVSLAHGHRDGSTIAIAALADRPVGVDVEAVRPRHPDLPARMLNEREAGLIEKLDSDSDRAVVTAWTLKEAVLKARRSGLRYAPRNLTIRPGAPGEATVHGADGSRWEAAWCERFGCIVSVAAAPLSDGVDHAPQPPRGR